MLSLRGAVAAEVVQVDEVEDALLAADDALVGGGAGLGRQLQQAAGAEVLVDLVELELVVGGEGILDGRAAAGGAEAEQRVAVVGAAGVDVVLAVAGGDEQVAVGRDGGGGAAGPEGGQVLVGAGDEGVDLLERRRVVAGEDAVGGVVVGVGGPGDVDDAVVQGQAGALEFGAGVEGDGAVDAADAAAAEARVDDGGAAELLGAAGHVQGVQALDVVGGRAPDVSLVQATT